MISLLTCDCHAITCNCVTTLSSGKAQKEPPHIHCTGCHSISQHWVPPCTFERSFRYPRNYWAPCYPTLDTQRKYRHTTGNSNHAYSDQATRPHSITQPCFSIGWKWNLVLQNSWWWAGLRPNCCKFVAPLLDPEIWRHWCKNSIVRLWSNLKGKLSKENQKKINFSLTRRKRKRNFSLFLCFTINRVLKWQTLGRSSIDMQATNQKSYLILFHPEFLQVPTRWPKGRRTLDTRLFLSHES